MKENIENNHKTSRLLAIKIASAYKLQNEVIFCMDVLGMSPDEALLEWDL